MVEKRTIWEGKHMNGGGKSHERESLETDI